MRPFLAALSVASASRTAAWYRDHFGFRILSLDSLSRPGIAAALLERGGFHLEIVAVRGSLDRRSALPDTTTNASLQGLYKLGLWVPDADSSARALQAAGVSLYRPLATDSSLAGGVRYFLVRDPDGTVVQVFGPLRRD
ncbi:MAG TPA: VOC family protein [Gemmatimonadales bacterium]|nr:VOC family protein [Gemmatimonadales bacterium]